MRLGIDIRPLLGTVRTGVGEYAAGLVKALADTATEGDEIVLWANASPAPKLENLLPELVGHPRVQFVATGYPNRLLNLSLWLLRRPKLDTFVGGVDVWLSPNSNFTRLQKIKHALVIHDLSFELYPEFFSRKMRLWHWAVRPQQQAKCADLVLTPSEYTGHDVATQWGVGASKLMTASPALSINFVAAKIPRENFAIPAHYFLCLGTLEPRKNIAAVVVAFSEWRKNHPNVQLIIAGAGGWDKRLLKLAQQQPGVHVRTSISAQEKSALLQHADCLVYPSWYEGFGLPLLEAMAAGTPVIASARASLPEVAQTAAHYVHPDKPDEIIAAWKALENQSYRADLITRGHTRVHDFSWEKTSAALWSRLRAILA